MSAPPLKLLQIDLTDECPLFCTHCSNSSGPSRETHFPINKLLEIIKEGAALGVRSIVYSGGEPLCYPQLSEALSTAQCFRIETIMFTTGIEDRKTRLPIGLDRWVELKQQGLTSLHLRTAIFITALFRPNPPRVMRSGSTRKQSLMPDLLDFQSNFILYRLPTLSTISTRFTSGHSI